MKTLLLLCLLLGLVGCGKHPFEVGQIVRVKLDGQRGQVVWANRLGDVNVRFARYGGGYDVIRFEVEALEVEKP